MSKKVIRIISFVLVVVTLLGFIIPYVSATEIENDDTEVIAPEITVDPDVDDGNKYGTPPTGFKLIETHDSYRVEKVDDNINVWFQIPIEPDTPRLNTVAFIVDLDKNMVIEQVVLNAQQTYVNGLRLANGYYALISGDYAFGDQSQKYEINGGKIFYFYIGPSYELDNSKYGVQLHVVDDMAIELSLQPARENTTLRDNVQNPIYNSEVSIPQEIIQLNKDDIIDIEPDEKPTEPEIHQPEPEEPEKPKREFFLITIIKDSWVWLVLLAAAGIAYKLIEAKKKQQLIKNIESDRNDKGRFE